MPQLTGGEVFGDPGIERIEAALIPPIEQQTQPEVSKEILTAGVGDIQSDFDRFLIDVTNCVKASLSMVQAGTDVFNNRVVGVLMELQSEAQNFLAESKAIISSQQDFLVIDKCEEFRNAVQFIFDNNAQQFLDAETLEFVSILESQVVTMPGMLVCDVPVPICDDAGNLVDVRCGGPPDANNDDNGKPTQPTEETCESEMKVEICGLDQLTANLEQIANCCEVAGPKGRLVAWYNCDDNQTRLMGEGENPAEPIGNWVEVGEFQETLTKLVECLCEIDEGVNGEEDKPKKPFQLFQILLGLEELVQEKDCFLPVLWGYNIQNLEAVRALLEATLALGTATAVVALLPFIGDDVPKPSVALLILLSFMLIALNSILSFVKGDPCFTPRAMRALVSRVMFTNFERLLPGAYQEQIELATIHLAFYCPKEIPTIDSVHLAFLSDDISLEDWRCLVRANGQHEFYAQDIMKSRRSKLNAAELTALLNRKEIGPEEHSNRIRQLGYIEGTEAEEFRELSKQFPGQSDLIHFMVRDTEDAAIVNRFNLTDKFDQKFRGQIKEWAEFANVPVEVMEKNWIAHWRYPGYRQLTEAMHRFRNEPDGSDIKTTEDDVRVALEADDLPEFWVKRLIAASFNPLTRVDARRAFNIGAITTAELKKSFDDLGYSDSSSTILVKFSKQQRLLRWYRHPAVKAWAAGNITLADFRKWLEDDGIQGDDIVLAHDRAKLLQRVATTKQCVSGVHKRFMLGDLTDLEARAELVKIGLNADDADQKILQWGCEKQAKGKFASLTQLCQWLENGTMNAVEFMRRLLNIGWDNIEATRIVKVCSDRIALKITKTQQAEIRRQRSEAAKLQSQAEKEEKQRLAALAKASTQADRAAKARLSRDKILAAAAEKFGKRIKAPFVDVFTEIKAFFNRLSQAGSGRQDVIAQAIKEAADDPLVMDLPQLFSDAIQYLTPTESFAN